MFDKQRVDFLTGFLKRSMDEGAFPGACFGIVSGKERYSGYMGYAQPGPVRRKMRANSIFDLASLSKVIVTTTAVMILMEGGEIRLQDRVKDILPDYRHEGTTILELLTHTSGLPAEIKFYKFCRDLDETLSLLYKTDFEYSPDSKVVYSDLGFMLLGLIIESVSGQTLDSFARKYIAKPLYMKDTCYNPPEELKDRCVATEFSQRRGVIVGQVNDGNAYMMGGVSGHAGLFSTLPDLMNFAEMLLNEGCYAGKKILSPASIDLMGRSYTDCLGERRGLGWQLKTPGYSMGDLVSDDVMYHTGFTGTSILVDRRYGLAFVLLTNRAYPSRENQKLLRLRGYINNIAMGTITSGKGAV